jgi:hypothetical protein
MLEYDIVFVHVTLISCHVVPYVSITFQICNNQYCIRCPNKDKNPKYIYDSFIFFYTKFKTLEFILTSVIQHQVVRVSNFLAINLNYEKVITSYIIVFSNGGFDIAYHCTLLIFQVKT